MEDVANVTFNYCLPRPTGAACEFVKWLYEWKFNCSDQNCNLVSTDRRELLDELEAYCEETDLDDYEKDEVKEWIESLPWDIDNIILQFSWEEVM